MHFGSVSTKRTVHSDLGKQRVCYFKWHIHTDHKTGHKKAAIHAYRASTRTCKKWGVPEVTTDCKNVYTSNIFFGGTM